MLQQTSGTLRLVIVAAFIVAIGFGLLGIWLVYLGQSGQTEFSFFGQAFKSASVGVAAIFIGAVHICPLGPPKPRLS